MKYFYFLFFISNFVYCQKKTELYFLKSIKPDIESVFYGGFSTVLLKYNFNLKQLDTLFTLVNKENEILESIKYIAPNRVLIHKRKTRNEMMHYHIGSDIERVNGIEPKPLHKSRFLILDFINKLKIDSLYSFSIEKVNNGFFTNLKEPDILYYSMSLKGDVYYRKLNNLKLAMESGSNQTGSLVEDLSYYYPWSNGQLDMGVFGNFVKTNFIIEKYKNRFHSMLYTNKNKINPTISFSDSKKLMMSKVVNESKALSVNINTNKYLVLYVFDDNFNQKIILHNKIKNINFELPLKGNATSMMLVEDWLFGSIGYGNRNHKSSKMVGMENWRNKSSFVSNRKQYPEHKLYPKTTYDKFYYTKDSPKKGKLKWAKFEGILYVFNIKTKQYIELETGQSDSEVLTIKDSNIIYRVYDQIFTGKIDGNQIINKKVLIEGKGIEYINLAFFN